MLLARRILLALLAGVLAGYLFCCLVLVMLRWVHPWTTCVQTERRVEALLHHAPYHKRYEPVEDLEEGRVGRGGSTITQQLVKNLFATTSRSWLRKVFEFSLAPVAELILGKQRILDLYLNVIEWGPGIYGAEAAAQTYFHTSAARLTREQCAHLAAVIPNPRRRKVTRMNDYSAAILVRMRQMGW